MQGSVISAPSGVDIRVQLISALRLAIQTQQLSQSAAARLIGTDQPTLSKILSGGANGVTIDRLISWLNRLGHSVDIHVASQLQTPRTATARHG
jgi:predicted XRE-type DNA-binding protein